MNNLKALFSVVFTPVLNLPKRPADFLDHAWQILLILTHVCLGRAWLPILIAIIEFFILTYVPQAQEVLFSMFEPFENPRNQSIFTSGLWAFLCAAAMLSLTFWYCARLLCTVDRDSFATPRLTSKLSHRAHKLAIILVPRWLGTASLALATASTLVSGLFPGKQNVLTVWYCFSLQLVLALLAQKMLRRKSKTVIQQISMAMAFLLMIVLYLISNGAEISNVQTTVTATLLCGLPVLLHIVLILRRKILRWCSPNSRTLHPASRRDLHEVHGRLLAIAITMTTFLLLRAGTRPWTPQWDWLSSPIVVLLFLGVVTTVGTLATLWFGRVMRWTPGIGWVTVLLVAYFLGTAMFREPLGSEHLAKAVPELTPSPTQSLQSRGNILINAHGGGLRAAYFTASVLARIDDLSCGRFGQRLGMASGVSGGSLGIAVYLMVRQDRLRHEIWAKCQLGSPFIKIEPYPTSQELVDKILLNDFLSPVLANLLSSDLLPGSVYRGQALLDGWQKGATSALGDKVLSFTDPLELLAGSTESSGASTSPNRLVIFNATDVSTGTRFELSTAMPQACGHVTSIGEAVLHSARFPIVSPAGACHSTDGVTHALVDGGYYDNSGAEALSHHGPIPANAFWLNINGNPPESECRTTQASIQPGMWSAVSTLLASRKGHTVGAERQIEHLIGNTGGTTIGMNLSLNEAFKSTIKDPERRCNFVRRLRSAPLGWYLTKTTAYVIRTSVLSEANKACFQIPGLCGQFQ